MIDTEIIYIILFSLPAYTSLICGLLILSMLKKRESSLEYKVLKLMIAMYFTFMLVWLSFVVYTILPDIYVMLNSFVFLICLLVYMISYRIIFEMTKINLSEEFSKIHYVLPLSGFVLILVWSFFIPWDVQLLLGRSGETVAEWYSEFFNSKVLLLLCMNLVYTLLGLRRIIRYRKVVVNYSADEYRGSVSWLYQFVYVSLAIFVVTVCVFIISKDRKVPIWLLSVPVIFAIFKYVIIAYNVLLESFVIIKTDLIGAESGLKGAKSIRIIHLESYIRKNKPYLNPKLKITEITKELNTNRTYLSMIINRTYGMNFCRYINRLRLEEFERLKLNPKNANLSEQELVTKAGFSDYRGYRRVKQREERITLYTKESIGLSMVEPN